MRPDHELPPHAPDKKLPGRPRRKLLPEGNRPGWNLAVSVLAGSLFALVVGLVLYAFDFQANVIIATVAPVWAASVTMIFSMRRH